jgi:hypothetical protein
MTDDPQEQNQNDYNDDQGGGENRRGSGRRWSFLFFTSGIRIAINRNQLSDKQKKHEENNHPDGSTHFRHHGFFAGHENI